jgi:Transcription initiation factor IIF, small subunit (RAP30)
MKAGSEGLNKIKQRIQNACSIYSGMCTVTGQYCGTSELLQVESDIESDTSVFDVKSPTRENGNSVGRRRSCTSTNNNNTTAGSTSTDCNNAVTPATTAISCPTSTETMAAAGTASSPPTIKAVRSSSESKGTLEKGVTTTSGSLA